MIFFLNYPHNPTTGGHKYNFALLSYLKNHYSAKVVTTPRCADVYSSWHKTFAPLAELKWYKRIK